MAQGIRRRLLGRFPKARYFLAPTLFVITLLVMYLGPQVGGEQSILEHLAEYASPIALMAIGVGLVLATGGVDISIVGVATLAGVILALLDQLQFPLWLSFCLALSFGLSSGSFLGWIISRYQSPPLILSWAVGTVWTILSLHLAGNAQIDGGNVTAIRLFSITKLHYWEFGPNGFWFATFFVLITFLLTYSGLTSSACAIGADRDSAVYAGIRLKKVTILCYAISGLLSALAGSLTVFQTNVASTNGLIGSEISVIAICVIGGTSMSGGYLSIWSIVAASFFWSSCRLLVSGIDMTAGSAYQQRIIDVIFSLILILVALIFGKALSGHYHTIYVERKTSEDS